MIIEPVYLLHDARKFPIWTEAPYPWLRVLRRQLIVVSIDTCASRHATEFICQGITIR
ncbi:hypothetical protein D3C81_325060 [compost metagenome]